MQRWIVYACSLEGGRLVRVAVGGMAEEEGTRWQEKTKVPISLAREWRVSYFRLILMPK